MPGEVDVMFWDDASDLLDYWRDYPPAHVLVRSAVGYRPPGDATGSDTSLDDVRDISVALGGL